MLEDRRIGSYKLLEKLGAGGMGEVYRAADTRLNRHVALKILSPDQARHPHSVERFRREACSVAALNHPNIVTIYSVEEHEGLHFLTMELVQGNPLSSVIPPEGLPLRRFLEIAVPLAEALEAAHERGIVHRDLKPSNVMVNHGDRVKVLDFGIAKIEPDNAATVVEGAQVDADSLTGTGLVIGTPAYMSPEQALGRNVDHRTDIFSLGVMLYEMATGSRPFRGEAASDTFAAVLRDKPPAPSTLNPQLPDVLDKLIAGCLEKDVSRRIQTARELRLSLQALAVGLSRPAASFPTDTTPLTRLRRRWSAPVAAVAGTCCLILLLAATKPQLRHFLTGSDKAAAAGESTAVRRPGLAVLPLNNFSKDPEYFVDGMTDALIASLADIRGVRVISRQSVMRFKSSSEPLPAIAARLGVEILVQGSVMRVGNRVRITVQLLRADPEQQIWADNYERDFGDVLALQNEVARAISREIQVKLEPEDERRLAKARPVDPRAYDAYLKGRHAWSQRSPAGFASALELFQEALRRDPKLALAHAGIADVYSFGPVFGFASPEEALPQARKHAEAALQLDPDLADAHVSLGVVHLFGDRDWDRADTRLRRALALSPNSPMAHQLYAINLMARGRLREVAEQTRLHYELDPLSPTANVNMGVQAYEEGRKDEAIRYFQKATSLAPGFFASYLRLSGLYRREGKHDLALETFQKSLAVRYPQLALEMDRAYRKGGRKAALRTAALTLEKSSGEAVVPDDLARIYEHLGQRSQALDCLEESYRRGYPGILLLGANAEWDWPSLRSEPRFRSLVDQISRKPGPSGSAAPARSGPRGCGGSPPPAAAGEPRGAR